MCPSQRDARLFGSRLKGVRKTATNSRCGSYRVGVDFHCPNFHVRVHARKFCTRINKNRDKE